MLKHHTWISVVPELQQKAQPNKRIDKKAQNAHKQTSIRDLKSIFLSIFPKIFDHQPPSLSKYCQHLVKA